MQISIIIPLYKVEKYIERCLKSVIMQTFTDYGVILVDDASPDNSLQIATQLLKENNIIFQTIKHKENKKQGTARNNGLKIAKGEYIFFIDADDELASKNTLQLLHTEIEKNSYDFVTAKEQHIENGKEKINIEESNSIAVLRDAEILKALSKNNISPVVWNKLIRKDFLLQNNIHFFENTYFEDIPYCFILCNEAKKVAILNQITYTYYFQENSSATTSTLSNKKIKDAINMCNELVLYAHKNTVHKKTGTSPIHQIITQSISYILTHSSVIADKEKWIRSYSFLQQMYHNNWFKNDKKILFLPSNLAYYLVNKTKSLKNINFINKIHRYVLLVLNIYNLRGRKVLLKEIVHKIC